MKKAYFTQSVIVTVLAISSLMACKKASEDTKEPPKLVSITTVAVADAIAEQSYPATISATQQIELRPQTTGFITSVNFTDGSVVSKGQLLYTIDNQSQVSNYAQADANVSVQAANLELAQKNAARYAYLDNHDAIAKQAVDQSNAQVKVAQRQLAAAQAARNSIETSVKYTRVYAPFSGTVGISMVKVGSPVSAGQTVLNTISSNGAVFVDIAVNQTDAYEFSKMMNRELSESFNLYLGESLYPYNGKVVLLDRAVDASTGTLKVRLEFQNPQEELKTGMTAVLKVKKPQANAILVPFVAVNEEVGEYSVFIVKGKKVTAQKVKLGVRVGDKIIVTEGLKGGEQIVTDGVQNLKEGDEITTQVPKEATKK